MASNTSEGGLRTVRTGPPAVRVLVVEDDPDAARTIAEALRDGGYTVQVAHDGDQALAVCEGWSPDAIVLDHNLPVMTGEQFLQEIRWRPALSRVPVLLISGLQEVAGIARRLHLPHFLCKPFGDVELLETLAVMIAAPPPITTRRSTWPGER